MTIVTTTRLDPDAEAAPAVVIRGSLDAEETAALTAVLQALSVQAGQHPQPTEGGQDHDRTLERRRRLGLWARPGANSWRHAAGQH